MKKSIKMFLVGFMCIGLFGCSNQSSGQATMNNTTTVSNESTSDSVSEKTDKNVFSLSDTTDKEEYYLTAINGSDYSPFEVSFDKNYSKLTCKLYQLDNKTWKRLQEFDLELSGDTFWFLVKNNLLEATILYKNVNAEQGYSLISGGRSFETIEPSFGIHGVTSHYASTDSVNVEEGVEFPVIANIYWKSSDDSLFANTEDFYYPEKLDLGKNEAYYMLTFTFFEYF